MSIFDQNPKNDPFSTPPRFQKSWKMALLAKTGVFKQDLNRKKGGGVGVYPGTPQKGHFWPFLAIFGDFWPFLTPFLGCPRPPKNPPPQDVNPPQKPPWPRRTISNNRVIRPQIWNLRRKRGFFCTPTGAGNVSESGRNSRLLSIILIYYHKKLWI